MSINTIVCVILALLLVTIISLFHSCTDKNPAGSNNNDDMPSAPTNAVVVAGDQKVTITWDSVTNATAYNLYWADTSGVSKDDK